MKKSLILVIIISFFLQISTPVLSAGNITNNSSQMLVRIAENALAEKDKKAIKNFMTKSDKLIEDDVNSLDIWVCRLKAALYLNDEANSLIAYQKVKLLGGFNKSNPEMYKLLFVFNKKGWFGNNKDFIKAAKNGDDELVKALIASGANLNYQVKNGSTALMIASEEGHNELVKVLIQAGVDVNAKANYGQTALMFASSRGHTEIVKALVKARADVNAMSTNGGTSLMLASFKGPLDVIEILIQAGADINAKSNLGWTALLYAACGGNTEVVRTLVQSGADLKSKDKYGTTALMLAKSTHRKETIKILTQAEATLKSKQETAAVTKQEPVESIPETKSTGGLGTLISSIANTLEDAEKSLDKSVYILAKVVLTKEDADKYRAGLVSISTKNLNEKDAAFIKISDETIAKLEQAALEEKTVLKIKNLDEAQKQLYSDAMYNIRLAQLKDTWAVIKTGGLIYDLAHPSIWNLMYLADLPSLKRGLDSAKNQLAKIKRIDTAMNTLAQKTGIVLDNPKVKESKPREIDMDKY